MDLNLLKKQQHLNRPEKNLQEKQKALRAPQNPQSRSPNLLQNVLAESPKEKQQYKISKFAFFLIILIQLLFIGLSIYNSLTITNIDVLQNDVNRLEASVLAKEAQELQVRDVISRTQFLKELDNQKIELAPIIKPFIETIPNNITLLRSSIENKELVLTVESAAPLDISLLISRYFENGFAKEIVIQSANLNNTTGRFTASLEVLF